MDEGLPDGFLEATLDGLREAGWVLIPPDKARELRALIGVVLDAYLVVPTLPPEQ